MLLKFLYFKNRFWFLNASFLLLFLCFEKFILQLGLVEICSPTLNQHFIRKLKELWLNMVFIYFSPKKKTLRFFKKQKLKGTLEFQEN